MVVLEFLRLCECGCQLWMPSDVCRGGIRSSLTQIPDDVISRHGIVFKRRANAVRRGGTEPKAN